MTHKEIEHIAMLVHAVTRAHSASLGDNTIPHWECAGDSIRTAAIMAVEHRIANPDAQPKAPYNSWILCAIVDAEVTNGC